MIIYDNIFLTSCGNLSQLLNEYFSMASLSFTIVFPCIYGRSQNFELIIFIYHHYERIQRDCVQSKARVFVPLALFA